MPRSILLTGATGFVGSRLRDALVAAGHRVRCTSRDPQRAARQAPDFEWAELDVARPETLGPALSGCSVAYYLVHEMREGGDYEEREVRAARDFCEAASAAGVERITYLGGIRPAGTPSKHLRSRLRTGEVLRAGPVPVVELRAGMIIGGGSESWIICRDLATRLPMMLLPEWVYRRSEPIALADVIAALVHTADAPPDVVGAFSLPGPERLTGKEILERIAALQGRRLRALKVPLLSPQLSSHWLRIITRADPRVASELVQGLTSDLLAQSPTYWERMPGHSLTSFDDAARRGLDEEAEALPDSVRRVERWLGAAGRLTGGRL